MVTPYKGIIRILCIREACSKNNIQADASVDCYGCASAQIEVLDLNDEVICCLGPATGEEKKAIAGDTLAEGSDGKPDIKSTKSRK